MILTLTENVEGGENLYIPVCMFIVYVAPPPNF